MNLNLWYISVVSYHTLTHSRTLSSCYLYISHVTPHVIARELLYLNIKIVIMSVSTFIVIIYPYVLQLSQNIDPILLK